MPRLQLPKPTRWPRPRDFKSISDFNDFLRSAQLPELPEDVWALARATIRHPLQVSTLAPTSSALAKTMLRYVDFSEEGRIIEVGCGGGAITRWLAPRLRSPEQFLGIELDQELVDFLRSHYPQLQFECGPAENLSEWQAASTASAAVSSLPWSMFDNDLQKRTITAIHQALKPNACFTTYVCITAAWQPQAQHFAGLLHALFSRVEKTPIVWQNLPPAYIYVARK